MIKNSIFGLQKYPHLTTYAIFILWMLIVICYVVYIKFIATEFERWSKYLKRCFSKAKTKINIVIAASLESSFGFLMARPVLDSSKNYAQDCC